MAAFSATPARVAIVRCADYAQDKVDAAVREAVRLCLGDDLSRLVRPPVLVKPNVLNPRRPEDGVCTHPAVLKAVIRLLRDAGATDIGVGDSSGGSGAKPSATDKAFEVSGLAAAAREAGAVLRVFDHEEAVSVPNPRGARHRNLVLARSAVEAGTLVSVPKLKTHALTTLTAAVKNLFGTVPGAAKRETHIQNPTVHEFAHALVDIATALRPALHVVDAVMAMEGEGPSGGSLVKLGLIVAGTDPVAVDAVLAALVGLPPERVPTTRLGAERGLGAADLGRIEVVGAPIAEARAARFRLPFASAIARHAPAGLARAAVSLLSTRPAFKADKCTRCGVCVKNCPAGALELVRGRPVPELADTLCIACYCCHELCPNQAVSIRYRNRLAGALWGLRRV